MKPPIEYRAKRSFGKSVASHPTIQRAQNFKTAALRSMLDPEDRDATIAALRASIAILEAKLEHRRAKQRERVRKYRAKAK